MRLYQLEYFIKVAECGSLTKAAQELYLSQPSLTKAISSLESEYGLELIGRTPRGIYLTTKGREFLQYAKSVVESCELLDRTFSKEAEAAPTAERIAIASQQFDFIYDILLRLYQEHEGKLLLIDFMENDRGAIVEMVEERRADIGLLVVSEEDSKIFKSEMERSWLEVRTLDRSSVYVCMGKHSPLFEQDSVDVEEAKKYPHLILDTEESMRREMKFGTVFSEISQERQVFCNTAAACRKFLKETDMILLIPKWVRGLLEREDIRCVPLTMDGKAYPEVNRLVWIKHDKEGFQPLEKRFMELLEQEFKEK